MPYSVQLYRPCMVLKVLVVPQSAVPPPLFLFGAAYPILFGSLAMVPLDHLSPASLLSVEARVCKVQLCAWEVDRSYSDL